VTKADFFAKCLLVVLPVVTKDYLLKNDVSDDEDEKIVQAHAIADFSAQIASSAAIDNAIETKSFNDKAKGDGD
jgi:hypothetical protein